MLLGTIALVALVGCQDEAARQTFQGYGEGEYIYLSAIDAGTLETLSVPRGARVEADQVVFSFDSTVQTNALNEAEGQREAARHQLANLMTGKREQEIAVLIAGQKRAAAALKLSEDQLARKSKLRKAAIVSQAEYDVAVNEHQRSQATLDELDAQINAARLTARVDEIGAANGALDAAMAIVDTARWRLEQRTVKAPKSGRIEELVFDVGEFVQPGQPVVSLLPDDGVKVRFFIPERQLGDVQLGQAVTFSCAGCAPGMSGTVRYIAQDAEYTPPVIFSQPAQQKMVFMAEAWPDDQTIIHPGQPVEVELAEPKP